MERLRTRGGRVWIGAVLVAGLAAGALAVWAGAGQTAASAATTTSPYGIQPVAPSVTSVPKISGKAVVGDDLTAGVGKWSGTTPISYGYQWELCQIACATIGGATGATYEVTEEDLGDTLDVIVTATNQVGSASATSAPTAEVTEPAGSVPCTSPSGARNAANPLALAAAPGSDPLGGAPFFIDGPAHGLAAGEIARLLGIDASVPSGEQLPAFPDSESWQQFLDTTVAQRLPDASATVRYEVKELEKIATEPEPQRISAFSEGGSPSGIAAFTTKLFCQNFTSDPGSVPIITTYFMHPVLGGCSTTRQIDAYLPLFEQRINAMVQATGAHRVVYLLELDAVGSTACMVQHHSIAAWERMLRYEVDATASLPHAVVYVEGGYSDANTPKYAAKILNAVDIRKVRGFFTNDTHLNWTINEITYGDAVSRLTHGAHFVISTAQNGNGPVTNPHPTTQGVEDLCNPPGRALGPMTTTSTGYPHVDGFLWITVPGISSGTCGGGPAAGTFWLARAVSMAANANGRLGPNLPSRPY